MTIQTSTLRPGLLISLKSSISGNVKYTRRDLQVSKIVEGGAAQAKWETERTIIDPVEHELATKTRTAARIAITRVCSVSAFGLLCPEIASADLEKGIAEARAIADAFNQTAKLTRISIYVITGRIAPDDVEAVKAINSEIRELLADMEQGIRNTDVRAIREAASRAKQIGSMLSPDAEARIRIAIDTARESAKRIVKAAGQAALEIDQTAIRKITESRAAFLDIDDAKPVASPAAEGRALDMSAPTAREDIGYAQPARAAEV